MRRLFQVEDETFRLGRKYLFGGYESFGSQKGKRYYKKAVSHIKRGAKYGAQYLKCRWRRCDPDSAYECVEKEEAEYKKATEILAKASSCGHDLAVMQSAFFLMRQTSENDRLSLQTQSEEVKAIMIQKALDCTRCAYDLGFAPAAYMLAILYREGYHSLLPDKKKSEFYFARFEELRASDQRQAVLSTKLPVYDNESKTQKQMNFYAWINWLMK